MKKIALVALVLAALSTNAFAYTQFGAAQDTTATIILAATALTVNDTASSTFTLNGNVGSAGTLGNCGTADTDKVTAILVEIDWVHGSATTGEIVPCGSPNVWTKSTDAAAFTGNQTAKQSLPARDGRYVMRFPITDFGSGRSVNSVYMFRCYGTGTTTSSSLYLRYKLELAQ